MRKQLLGCLLVATCMLMAPAKAEDEQTDVALISKVLLNLNNRITTLEKQQGKSTPTISNISSSNLGNQLQQIQRDVSALQQQINTLQQQVNNNQNSIQTLQGKMRFLDTDQ